MVSRCSLLLACICHSLVAGVSAERSPSLPDQFPLKDVKKVVDKLRQKSLIADIKKDCVNCEGQSYFSHKPQPRKSTKSRQLKREITERVGSEHTSSLLLDVSTASSNLSNQSCHHPAKRNVISILNKGHLLYGGFGILITELRFPILRILLEDKNISSAFIHTPSPNPDDPPKGHWNNRYAGSTLFYQVYEVEANNWRQVVGNLRKKKYLSEFETDRKDAFGSGADSERKQVLESLTNTIGRPIAERNVSYNQIHVTSESVQALDISMLLGRWKKDVFRRRIIREGITKLILVVSEEKRSTFSMQFTKKWCDASSKRDCFQLSMVRLILISIESAKCDGLHHEKAVPLRKRAANEKESTRKTNRNVTKLGKTNKQQDNDKTKVTYRLPTQVSKLEFSRHRPVRSIQSPICQRHPLWVNFEDLGWSEWIIAPRAIQAYRCSGTCPYPLGGRMNSTNHAMLMSMMNSVDPETSPMPCCVPTKFSSASLLYFDKSDNVVLQKYDDMIIEGCGCR